MAVIRDAAFELWFSAHSGAGRPFAPTSRVFCPGGNIKRLGSVAGEAVRTAHRARDEIVLLNRICHVMQNELIECDVAQVSTVRIEGRELFCLCLVRSRL